jgi:endonuclease/exonuclease/phosphatase family metal-dependent hydrolase
MSDRRQMTTASAQPMPTAPASGAHQFAPTVENRAATLAPGPLRVVAFNAQGGIRFDGIVRCFTREPLRGAGVILLSEADFGTRRSGRRKVASELADALGMSCAYVPEFGLQNSAGKIVSYLGNAILSREPLEDVIAIALPKVSARYPRMPRSLGRVTRIGEQAVIIAKIRVRGTAIWVCVAHLDSRAHPAGREMQMAAILEAFPSDGPAVLGGDLNTTTVELMDPGSVRIVLRDMLLNSRRFRDPRAHEPLLARLEDAGFATHGVNVEGRPTFTFARIVPPWMRPKLDWLALRDAQPVPGSARVIPARPSYFATRVSDHDFIAIDVAI